MAALTSRHSASHAPPTKATARRKSDKNMPMKKGKAKETKTKSSANRSDPPNHTTSNPNGEELPWDWVSITSPAISKVPPVFTKDGSYFFSLVGSSIQIHSVATGQIVSTLTAPKSKANTSSSFSCALINPHNPFQLITGSLDGSLMVWDFLDGTLLRTIDITQPIHLICAHERFRDYVFVAASKISTKTGKYDDNGVVLRVSLQNHEAAANSTSSRSADVLVVGKTKYPTGLAMSANGAWLVSTAGHKVYVARTEALSAGFTKYVSPERLTCLAFHPLEEYFSTGDEKGVIRLWYCLNDELAVNVKGVEKKTQTSAIHWHAHAVSALAFTSNGAYLLSGGEEAVLVIWQLHTRRKEFVPRLGSAINSVSVSRSKTGEEEYLLGLSDATYVFVNAGSLKISRSYSRIKIDPGTYFSDPSPSKSITTPIAVHALSSTILIPSSHPSSLQIYSPSTSSLVSELEVSPSNRVSRRDEKPIEYSKVEHCSISPSGLWMATVDVREADDDFHAEVYLKLWSWDERSTAWRLNTRIDKPHGNLRLSGLSFSHHEDKEIPLQLVTVGEDGIAKVWRLRSQKLKHGEREVFWVTRAALSYHAETPRSATWSRDSSLLAVSYDSCVVIYETSTYSVLQTFASSECNKPRYAEFVGAGDRNLVVGGNRQLVLWDIINHTVIWHHSTKDEIVAVIVHPTSPSFSVFERLSPSNDHHSTRISIFSLHSSQPTRVYSLPFYLRCKACYLGTIKTSEYSFLGISESWNLVAFGDSISLTEEDTAPKELSLSVSSRKRTLLQDIFGSAAFLDLTSSPPVEPHPQEIALSRTAEDTFNMPAYLIPSLNTFFDPLIHTFMKKRVAQDVHPTDTSSSMDMDEEGASETDDNSQNTSIIPRRSVTDSELKGLVGLFRKHAIQGQISSHQKVNGTPLINGATNSTTPFLPPSKVGSNGTVQKQKLERSLLVDDSSHLSNNSLPVTMNGKKRKKSH